MKNNIKMFREIASLSQEDLGTILQEKLKRQFNQSQVSNLEKSTSPPYPILKSVVDILNPLFLEKHLTPITVDNLMSEDISINEFSKVKRVIAVVGGKGGVGKSTLSSNLAAGFAIENPKSKVLFIDLDHQRNSTNSFVNLDELNPPLTIWDVFSKYTDNSPLIKLEEMALQPEYEPLKNIKVIPAHPQLSRADKLFNFEDMGAPYILQKTIEEEDFDVCIIDCCGGSGILVQNAIIAAHELIIPTSTGEFEKRTVLQLKEMLKSTQRLNPHFSYKVVFNQFNYRTRLAKQSVEEISLHYPVFKTKIPHLEVIKTAVNFRKPVFDYAPHEKGAKLMKAFVEEAMHGTIKTKALKRMVTDLENTL